MVAAATMQYGGGSSTTLTIPLRKACEMGGKLIKGYDPSRYGVSVTQKTATPPTYRKVLVGGFPALVSESLPKSQHISKQIAGRDKARLAQNARDLALILERRGVTDYFGIVPHPFWLGVTKGLYRLEVTDRGTVCVSPKILNEAMSRTGFYNIRCDDHRPITSQSFFQDRIITPLNAMRALMPPIRMEIERLGKRPPMTVLDDLFTNKESHRFGDFYSRIEWQSDMPDPYIMGRLHGLPIEVATVPEAIKLEPLETIFRLQELENGIVAKLKRTPKDWMREVWLEDLRRKNEQEKQGAEIALKLKAIAERVSKDMTLWREAEERSAMLEDIRRACDPIVTVKYGGGDDQVVAVILRTGDWDPEGEAVSQAFIKWQGIGL